MLVKKGLDIKSSEITPKKLYMNRRKFIASSAAVAGLGLVKPASLFSLRQQELKLKVAKKGEYSVDEKLGRNFTLASLNGSLFLFTRILKVKLSLTEQIVLLSGS